MEEEKKKYTHTQGKRTHIQTDGQAVGIKMKGHVKGQTNNKVTDDGAKPGEEFVWEKEKDRKRCRKGK